MLTETYPFTERLHLRGGTHRIYSSGDWGLSCINGAWAYPSILAWEIAVMYGGYLCYDTPLTNAAEIFATDEVANDFIDKAMAYFAANPEGPQSRPNPPRRG